jgi:hypothetical protein
MKSAQVTGGSVKICPACAIDPDPRGWSACASCRELNRGAPIFPDLSDAHVDRVARHLFRAFDDVNRGREPLHDFDVLTEDGRLPHWYALAREAIRLGALLPEDG